MLFNLSLIRQIQSISSSCNSEAIEIIENCSSAEQEDNVVPQPSDEADSIQLYFILTIVVPTGAGFLIILLLIIICVCHQKRYLKTTSAGFL